MMSTRRVEKEYDAVAHVYDAKWDFYTEATTGFLLSMVPRRKYDSILDASCGTGILSQELAVLFSKARIHCVDLSQNMLDQAQLRLKKYKRITFEKKDIEFITDDSCKYDLIVCNNALHCYSDGQHAIDQFYRLLKPKGVLVLSDWNRDAFTQKLYSLVKIFDFAHHRTYSTPEIKKMTGDFSHVTLDTLDINWFWAVFCVVCIK